MIKENRMEKVRLGDLIEVQSGYAFDSSKFNDLEKGMPLIRIRDVGKKETKTFFDGDYSVDFVIKKGDFLVGMDGDFRLAKWESVDALLNQRVCRLKITSTNLDKNYLFNFLPSELKKIEDKTSFATVKHLSVKKIQDIQIPLPPLEEQKRIATLLDTADSLRQKDKVLLQKYDALAQSIFLELFGDPVRNEKGWEKKFLNDVCTKITDGTHFSPEPKTKGFPYVTAKHVKSYGLDFYSKPTYVDEAAHNEIYKRCTPEFGDVLYIKDGATTGIACINTFNEPISLLSSLALLKVKKELINNYYLCFWLNNPKTKMKLLSEYMSGAAIQRYTLAKIKGFELIVPPIELQNQFAEQIQLIEKQKALVQENLKKSEDLFMGLLGESFE